MRAVERATQVRSVDVVRDPESPGRSVSVVKPVEKFEQQAGILGVEAFDPQLAILLVFTDILPCNEVVRRRPCPCLSIGMRGGTRPVP